MPTITEDLLNELRNAKNINVFLDKHEEEFIKETPGAFLNHIISSGHITIAEIAKASGVGEYIYKILNNTRKPSRNVIIAVGRGMNMTLDEIQMLLRISKFAILDSRDKRDSIIIYGFVNDMSVFDIDEMLEQNNLLTIN